MIAWAEIVIPGESASDKFGSSAVPILQSGLRCAVYLSQTGILVSGSDVLPANVEFDFCPPRRARSASATNHVRHYLMDEGKASTPESRLMHSHFECILRFGYDCAQWPELVSIMCRSPDSVANEGMVLAPRVRITLPTSYSGFVLGQTYSQDDINSGKALQAMGKIAYDNSLKRLEGSTTSCTKDTVHVRKEWRNMPGPERTAYVKAVECLMQSPQIYPNVTGPKLTSFSSTACTSGRTSRSYERCVDIQDHSHTGNGVSMPVVSRSRRSSTALKRPWVRMAQR
ncbi:hypothetical protein NPX13_g11015 [Xylaria arbuscula]|uniref:Uncharacterized protein n=1 Tax=Xylaria arbuscula TaxID=114810 RepID=A0A9W8THC4_9PEZI|nr:hypothetical protein NPX13_g11015 [Xylaria arbuscula]